MRAPEPVEIVKIAVPVLAEAVAVVLFIAVSSLIASVIVSHEPVTCRAGSVAALFTDCEVEQ
jgi:hypothetical protein